MSTRNASVGWLIGLCLAGVYATGCTSVATMRDARVLAPGETRVRAGVEASGHSAAELEGIIVPRASLGIDRGIAPRLEVGARLAGLFGSSKVDLLGGAVGARYQLVEDDRPGHLAVAIGLEAGWFWGISGGADAHVPTIALPVIAGLNLHVDHRLMLSGVVSTQWALSAGAHPVHTWLSGGGLGYAWDLTEAWGLLAEVTALYSPDATEGVDGIWALHGGLGVGYTW